MPTRRGVLVLHPSCIAWPDGRKSAYRKLQEPRAFTPVNLSTPTRSHKRTQSPRTFSPVPLGIHLDTLKSFFIQTVRPRPRYQSSQPTLILQAPTLFYPSHTPHIATMVSVPSFSCADCTLTASALALDARANKFPGAYFEDRNCTRAPIRPPRLDDISSVLPRSAVENEYLLTWTISS